MRFDRTLLTLQENQITIMFKLNSIEEALDDL